MHFNKKICICCVVTQEIYTILYHWSEVVKNSDNIPLYNHEPRLAWTHKSLKAKQWLALVRTWQGTIMKDQDCYKKEDNGKQTLLISCLGNLLRGWDKLVATWQHLNYYDKRRIFPCCPVPLIKIYFLKNNALCFSFRGWLNEGFLKKILWTFCLCGA